MKEEQQTRQQHAVPQNIMEVEFKLIGDMTVRQFAYLAVGGFLCYLIYSSGMPFLIRWGLIFFIGFLVLGMAFLPLEERGFDEWLRNFFTSCYSPTQRIWRKSLGLFTKAKVAPKTTAEAPPKPRLQPIGLKEIQQLVADLKKVAQQVGEKRLIPKVASEKPKPPPPKPPAAEEKPAEKLSLKDEILKLSAELEKLKGLEGAEDATTDVGKTVAFYRGELKRLEEKSQSLEKALTAERTKETAPVGGSPGEAEYRKQIAALEAENKALAEKMAQAEVSSKAMEQGLGKTAQEKESYLKDLQSKELEMKRLEEERNRAMAELMKLSQEVRRRPAVGGGSTTPVAGAPVAPPKPVPAPAAKPATAPRPAKPEELPQITVDIPNVIAGVVKDPEGKLLEGIMVVIDNAEGDPVRAVKTNKLGQFLISTPLPSGIYTVRVEAKGKSYSTVRVVCDGSVLKPIVFK